MINTTVDIHCTVERAYSPHSDHWSSGPRPVKFCSD